MQITPFISFKLAPLFNFSIFSLILLLSLPAVADTKLYLAEDIILIAVNGEKISKGHALHRKNPVTLNNGVNQLLVQFNAGIDENDDDDTGLRYQRTEASVIVFDSTDQTLTLQAPQVNSESDLDDFNKHPNWVIQSKEGKSIPLEVAVLERDGVQIGRDFERELEKFNETKSSAALNYLARGPIVINTINSIPNTQLSGSANTDASVIKRSNEYVVTKEQNTPAVSIDWLLYLYKQASPSVQEQFKRIIAQ